MKGLAKRPPLTETHESVESKLSAFARTVKPQTQGFLKRLGDVLDWQEIEAVINEIDRDKNQDRRFSPVVLLKMAILQYCYKLSVTRCCELLADRASWRHFVGLSLSDNVPDKDSLESFQACLADKQLHLRILELCTRQLRNKNFELKFGGIAEPELAHSSRESLRVRENQAVSKPAASLLMLNWRRPENLINILSTQAEYKCISEILIFNNNADYEFKYQHPKVKILNASTDFGLRTRWMLAALANGDSLIFQDDDILLPEHTIDILMKESLSDRARAYSLHGRRPSPQDEYSIQQVFGEVEIVLTRATCIHKSVVPVIFHQEARFREAGLLLPRLNGEDIFLSYCLMGFFGKKHKIFDLPSTELPSPFSLWKKPGHLQERTSILRECKRFFIDKTPGGSSDDNASSI